MIEDETEIWKELHKLQDKVEIMQGLLLRYRESHFKEAQSASGGVVTSGMILPLVSRCACELCVKVMQLLGARK